MSIFDDKGGMSDEAELAQLAKDNPDLMEADPPAQDEPAEQPEPEARADEGTQDKPEGQDQPQDDGQDQDEPDQPSGGKTVPLAALAKERAERRAMEAQLSQMRGQMEAMQRMFMQPQQQAQQQQQQEQPPNPDEDPIGALRHMESRFAALQQQVQAERLQARVRSDYAADAMQFSTRAPDFGHAYNYLVASRANELRALGHHESTVRQQIEREEFGIVLGALQRGESPAEAVYRMAAARGYQKAAPAARKPPAIDPDLQEARKRAATGHSEGGTAPKGDMSLEEISRLRGAAQDKALAKWERENLPKSSLFRN